MKRPHEDGPVEEEPSAAIPRLEKEESLGETKILQDLQTNLLKGNLNATIEKRLFETQKQYFKVYMEKLLDKVHIGKQVMDVIRRTPGDHDFEYTFTAAKSVIHSEMRMQQIRAFHAVFDMVYSLMWRYVHEKMVSPTLRHVLSDAQLNLAFEKYQRCYRADENDDVVEMQNLVYCIQEVLESQEPVKVSNPFHSRFTQQIKAMSEYVIALLISLAKPVQAAEERDSTARPVDPFEKNGAPLAQWVALDRPVSVVRAGIPSDPVSWVRVGEDGTISVESKPVMTEPEAISVEPETVLPEPEIVSAEHEHVLPEPEIVSAEPEHVLMEPEPVSAEHEHVLMELETVSAEHEHVLKEPEPVSAEAEHVLMELETVSVVTESQTPSIEKEVSVDPLGKDEYVLMEPKPQTQAVEKVVSVDPLGKDEISETGFDEFRGIGGGEKRDKQYDEMNGKDMNKDDRAGFDGIQEFHSTSFMNVQNQGKKYSKDTKIKPRSNMKSKKKLDR